MTTWRTDRRKTAERGYGARWQRARLEHLDEHPLCIMCRKDGRITPATVVDHVVKHEGDQEKFWDRSNWQSLCATHHSGDKQALERSGRVVVRIGADGWPIE